MSDQTPIPEFTNEAEEAAWWDAHPEVITERFRQAKAEGRLRRLSQTSLPGAANSTTVRIPAGELARVRDFAAKRGVSYQEYLHMLLHEALDAEEKRLAS